MKKTIASVIALTAAMLPAIASAAEGGAEEQGSWLALGFFVINFALFVFIIKYFAAAPIGNYFKDRSGLIRSTLARAQSAFAEAQDLANQAAKRAAGLETEVEGLIRGIERETQLQVKKIADTTQTAIERLHSEVSLTSYALADAAQRRVREELAATTARLAHELIARGFAASDQARLIEGFTERMESER
jgi:F0F1-type ATP synthase membrane subunit b/b'